MATSTSVISIEGMTCQSCVRNIEGVVGGLNGVQSIKVDLAAKQGTVMHNALVITGSQITERIDDMGFKARLVDGRRSEEVQVRMEGNQLVVNSLQQQTEGGGDDVKVVNLLGEPLNCSCGDQLIQISVKGEDSVCLCQYCCDVFHRYNFSCREALSRGLDPLSGLQTFV